MGGSVRETPTRTHTRAHAIPISSIFRHFSLVRVSNHPFAAMKLYFDARLFYCVVSFRFLPSSTCRATATTATKEKKERKQHLHEIFPFVIWIRARTDDENRTHFTSTRVCVFFFFFFRFFLIIKVENLFIEARAISSAKRNRKWSGCGYSSQANVVFFPRFKFSLPSSLFISIFFPLNLQQLISDFRRSIFGVWAVGVSVCVERERIPNTSKTKMCPFAPISNGVTTECHDTHRSNGSTRCHTTHPHLRICATFCVTL